MPVDLYGTNTSPPTVAVFLTGKLVGAPMNWIETMYASDQVKTPEFTKMNPQRTVPTLHDNGLCLNESRAMMQYLCNKYAKDDRYYPKAPEERAMVDCRLMFDIGTLYDRLATAYYGVCFFGVPKLSEADLKRLDEALGFLEIYVKDGFVAGKKFTIADVTVAITVSVIEAFGHDLAPFPKVREYFARCKKEIPGYEEYNQKGIDKLKAELTEVIKKARN